MKEIFNGINSIDNVCSSMLFSEDGHLVIYESNELLAFSRKMIEAYSVSLNWEEIRNKFQEISEAEFIFSEHMIYIRKLDEGFFAVLMDLDAPMEVVKLHIDILLPKIAALKQSKGFSRFFKFRQ